MQQPAGKPRPYRGALEGVVPSVKRDLAGKSPAPGKGKRDGEEEIRVGRHKGCPHRMLFGAFSGADVPYPVVPRLR